MNHPIHPRLVTLRHGKQRARIYPEQGFQLYGYERDMEDGQTASMIYTHGLDTEPSDRRHGNPVLFPAPGNTTLAQGLDRWVWKGQVLTMPFHGLARNLYWYVREVRPDRISGELSTNSSAQTAFPFSFRMRMSYQLEDRGLVLDAEVENTGDEAFPYTLGFHPYLQIPIGPLGSVADGRIRIPSGMRMMSKDAWLTFEGKPFPAREAAANEELVNSILLAESKARWMELEDHANRLVSRVSFEESEQDFPVWVIWSATPESPYVCLEPWTDVPNGLNRPETRRCPPKQIHRYRLVFTVRPM